MKRIINFFVIIIIEVMNIYAGTVISDTIPFFAEIKIDGRIMEDRSYLYVEIILLKEEGGSNIEWYLNEVWLDEKDLRKIVIIHVIHSRSNDKFSSPLLSDIKWNPGKSLECKYHHFYEPLNLKATKKGKGKYDWEVYGSCRYKLRPDDPNDVEHFLEIKSVKEIKLKYNKMRMLNLYYK